MRANANPNDFFAAYQAQQKRRINPNPSGHHYNTMQIFRIAFHNNGKVYQVHAEQVNQAELYGFIEVHDLLFDEHTSVVIDPAEEKLKNEFSGVTRLLLPMHAIIRIDEVEKRGQNKILDMDGGSSNVKPFPMPGPGNH
jgi:hypothetical protein